MKRLGWIRLIFFFWGTAVFVPSVLAHAELVSAEPAPGSTVAALTEIRLTFSEPIGPNGQIQLHQDFIPAAALNPVIDAEDKTVLVTSVPPLPDGVYTVQWSVTSADGHPISGSYTLAIDSSINQTEPSWFFSSWTLLGLGLAGLAAGGFALRRHKRS